MPGSLYYPNRAFPTLSLLGSFFENKRSPISFVIFDKTLSSHLMELIIDHSVEKTTITMI